MFSVFLMIAVLFGLTNVRRENYLLQPSYGRFEAALYNAGSRTAWSLSLAWITLTCVKGRGGLVDSFLSWGLFQPLAKMTYTAYLIHQPLIFVHLAMQSEAWELSGWLQVI
jgi:peptidoglycan/LPS O-acetylase OafA/YrhL